MHICKNATPLDKGWKYFGLSAITTKPTMSIILKKKITFKHIVRVKN